MLISLLCLSIVGAAFITLFDIFTFFRMSDEAFDTRYELRRINFPLLFKILATVMIIFGVAGLIVKDKIVCPSQLIDQNCIFLDSNSNSGSFYYTVNSNGEVISLDSNSSRNSSRNSKSFQYAGTRMPGALSRWIINFPPYLLGAAGVLILHDALIKRN